MKVLENVKVIYDLTMNERCHEKIEVLFTNGLHKLMIDLIEELEALEDRGCDGCEYDNDSLSDVLDYCAYCSRRYEDKYKTKE